MRVPGARSSGADPSMDDAPPTSEAGRGSRDTGSDELSPLARQLLAGGFRRSRLPARDGQGKALLSRAWLIARPLVELVDVGLERSRSLRLSEAGFLKGLQDEGTIGTAHKRFGLVPN